MIDIYETWDDNVMYDFATHFIESDNEWISLDDLLSLFRNFTGKDWLSRPMFLSRYKPHTHFKKQIKHFRNKGGCRKDRVGYNIKQVKPFTHDSAQGPDRRSLRAKGPQIVPCIQDPLVKALGEALQYQSQCQGEIFSRTQHCSITSTPQ